MSDTNTAGSAPPTKTALQSTTIQGAIVTVIAAFAPTIAKEIGVDAQQIMDAVSAVLSLVGFAMVIVGRMKASRKIV